MVVWRFSSAKIFRGTAVNISKGTWRVFLTARCDIPWFRITRWRKPPYRVTLAPQTHNVTWLWCREVHKCSQVQQRVCIPYVCILYVVYALYPLSYTFATILVYASRYTRQQCFLSIFVTRTAESTRYMWACPKRAWNNHAPRSSIPFNDRKMKELRDKRQNSIYMPRKYKDKCKFKFTFRPKFWIFRLNGWSSHSMHI